jgi:hypothetical protein
MKWATRAGIHIDRAACAWLIRRHVDPDAEFVFVTDRADVPADATPFDMRDDRTGVSTDCRPVVDGGQDDVCPAHG